MVDLEKLVRANVLRMEPYSSARDEFSGEAEIFLDANENAYGAAVDYEIPLHRYPDPHQRALKLRIGELYGIETSRIFLGNGSDEVIDLLMRTFCEPRQDAIAIMPPTYGMYQVCAEVNDLQVVSIPLRKDFSLDMEALEKQLKPPVKIIFICSPNNPTGHTFPIDQVQRIASAFEGLVVVDEAYIDFSPQDSVWPLLQKFDNVVIMRTFSKSWGGATIRLGMAFADARVVSWMSKIKMPYNVSGLTQKMALKMLDRLPNRDESVLKLIEQRQHLQSALEKSKLVEHVFPSRANFILVRFKDSNRVFRYLLQQGIIVRDRSRALHCENCLRITVGTERENERLLKALHNLEKEV